MIDYHMHTKYSDDVRDAGNTVLEMCGAALDKGLRSIAITDHLEIDAEHLGFQRPLDIDAIYSDIQKAREVFKGRLDVLFGTELAQPRHFPEVADSFLKKYDFDFIIGSVHCLRNERDFYYMDFSEKTDNELYHMWERYLAEMMELIDWGMFHTLAHVTYPLRYFKDSNRDYILDMEKRGREYFEDIFKAVIYKGICLEVNTSGLRGNLRDTLPGRDLLMFYRELGGSLLTVGSDAHFARDVGSGIGETLRDLKEMGFGSVIYYQNGSPKELAL